MWQNSKNKKGMTPDFLVFSFIGTCIRKISTTFLGLHPIEVGWATVPTLGILFMLHLLAPLFLQWDKFDQFYEGSEITYHKNGNNMVLSDYINYIIIIIMGTYNRIITFSSDRRTLCWFRCSLEQQATVIKGQLEIFWFWSLFFVRNDPLSFRRH